MHADYEVALMRTAGASWGAGWLCGLTFELTGPMRRDGLARTGRLYRVPQAGPRQPAVAGPVVQRAVRPHPTDAREVGCFCRCATKAIPSRLTAEQGRYSAAAGCTTNQRLAARGAASGNQWTFVVCLGARERGDARAATVATVVFGYLQLGNLNQVSFSGLESRAPDFQAGGSGDSVLYSVC